jgi:aconitate decarboxylase
LLSSVPNGEIIAIRSVSEGIQAEMATSSTESLAAWVVQLKLESLSKSVVDAAVKSFTNYVGCAIGGHTHEATQKVLAAYAALPRAPGTCSLLGNKTKVDPLQAALVNTVASHIHDYDDTHLSTVIHPTTAVASALLAYVEASGKAVSGADFITALFAGIEVQCLLGLAVYPSHYQQGWHITASVGSIGAAVAVGKAMSLTQEQMVNAIGIASTQVNGMRIHFGTHAKPLGAGFASQAGLQSAYLAKGGMTAASNSIEGPRGWIECVCPDPHSAREKLPKFVDALVGIVHLPRDYADDPA